MRDQYTPIFKVEVNLKSHKSKDSFDFYFIGGSPDQKTLLKAVLDQIQVVEKERNAWESECPHNAADPRVQEQITVYEKRIRFFSEVYDLIECMTEDQELHLTKEGTVVIKRCGVDLGTVNSKFTLYGYPVPGVELWNKPNQDDE